MSIRRGVLAFVAFGIAGCAMAAAACKNRSAPTSGPTTTTDGTSESASSSETPMKEIQKQLAAQFKVSPGDIEVSVIDDPKVPGLVPFTASVNAEKLGRHAAASGVLDGKTILVEKAAMSAVARAWGYGAKRTVSAGDVATVFGQLHSESVSTTALMGETRFKAFKANAQPELAAAAQLPSEETVDGLPAVKYCISSSGPIPFTVVTAIVKPDFTVELRTQEIGQAANSGRD